MRQDKCRSRLSLGKEQRVLEWGTEKDAETGEGRTAEQKKTEIRQRFPKKGSGRCQETTPWLMGLLLQTSPFSLATSS